MKIASSTIIFIPDDAISKSAYLPPQCPPCFFSNACTDRNAKQGLHCVKLQVGGIGSLTRSRFKYLSNNATAKAILEPVTLYDHVFPRIIDQPMNQRLPIFLFQVDSLALEELPLRRGARGLPHRLKTQAGKLRTRLKNIKRPTFALPERQRAEKTRSTSSGRSDKSRTEKRPSRMDRIRSSFSERPRFNLPNRPRFSLPDRSKFHLPERPKFNLKKPNIRLPNALARTRRSPPPNERSTEATVGSRGRNIFDFSTYPRIFDRKSKNKGDYATSTPKDSRAQSAESATFPRPRKGMVVSKRWTRRFENTTAFIDEDRSDADTAAERSPPWRHPSREEPRLSLGFEGDTRIPWEEKDRPEELQYMDYEQESPEISERHAHPTSEASRTEDDSYDREQTESNPRLYQDQDAAEAYLKATGKEEVEEGEVDWRAEERIARDEFRAVQRSRSLEEVLRARGEEGFDGSFAMVDPRRYGVHKTPSEEEEYDEEMEEEEEAEPSSAQSDREQQQSSGSSCDRRRRGVIEEIDSDEFFLREAGLSQDDMNLGKYLTSEIRDALRAEHTRILVGDDSMPAPPQRPTRNRSLRKQKEGSVESYEAMPPVRPKRDPNRSRRSESVEEQFRERTRSDSKHRIVYQTEGEPPELPIEPLDDIVVVKPIRRKSKSSQRSQSQVRTDTPRPPSPASVPPVVPTRRKRLRKETPTERRNGELAAICNGHTEWAVTDSAPEKPLPLPPTDQLPDDQEAYTAEEIIATSEENIRMLATRLREDEYMEPVPVPPKRRSRSRGTSVAQDEDRTSHGAESLPEIGYVEEDIPRDDLDFGRDLSGYAIIEKRDKPPRPPPPRRKKDKFATTPRPTGPTAPKRPQRAYSTLGPSKSREMNILTDDFEATTLQPAESAPYIEIDSDDGEHKDLRSDEVLSKMQGRPLPAPPRPPRVRKDRSLERSAGAMNQESITETTTATQTDPLPDDMVIEEEVTQAKLVVAPSRSGSQIMVSTERIPSPSNMSTPPVPPLPISQRMRREEQTELPYDTVSLKSPSPAREMDNLEDRHLSAPHLEERIREQSSRVPSIHSALLSNEPVRISNLEVGDLRVDRLNVSQIEAGKIVASEVDALVITASELKSMTGMLEEGLSPSIIKELIAIRSHLETVAASQAQQSQVREGRTIEEEKKTDIPRAESETVQERPADEEKSRPTEEQKVVKREVVETKDTRTQSIARANVEDNETPVTHTLSVTQVEFSDKDIFLTTQSPSVVQPTEDKSLRIFDSESLLSLSTATAKQPNVEESRASLPTSRTKTDDDATQSRLSPDRMSEPSNEQLEGSTDSKVPAEFSALMTEQRDKDKESSPERPERKSRKSRSRSPSPIRISPARQTASPVRSLPPAISVTPDTPDNVALHGITSETQPQRAVISYTSYNEVSERESQRESSQSPVPSFPLGGTHLIAFPASQIPSQFYSLTSQPVDSEPSVADSARQLIRVLRLACMKAIRHFVRYTASMVGEESREKIREVELTICAMLLLVTGLLIFLFGSTRTVTHHHHWDYFNPPK